MIFPCMTSATKSAFAASCFFNRKLSFSRHPQLRSISYVGPLTLSQSPGEIPSPPPSDKDWFMDGREVARQLKMELGIMSEDDDVNLEAESKGKKEESKFAASDAILESGRAAARELLREMNSVDDSENDEDEDQIVVVDNEDESKNLQPLASSNNEELQTSETSNLPPSDNQSPEDYFNLPSRKSHCMTICLVPPPSATIAWEQLTAVRKECKDPGYYRWPPHANIVYPFLEPVYNKDGEESKDDQRTKFRNEIAIHLSKAAGKCEPFDVTIDSFGTFGGKSRGVLWAYPKSKYLQACDNEKDGEEPLITLHSLLEQQFPLCKDQRKTGAFHPHMTVSHYTNNENALIAKKEVESKWEPVSFHVPAIYLLERKGDEGQFKIAATISLGAGSEVKMHDPRMPFPAMPEVEEEWVYDERMAMKNRRKKGNKGRRRGGASKERDATQQLSQEKS
mmetsp:Transcript_33206/g.69882  ORF Transcript_33206/g.69882 Transcript_33206/m.69882 type:complete len:452 (-) Transcript_33206:51-1406(-)